MIKEQRICSKCGGDGPFPRHSRICTACKSKASIEWARAHPERAKAKQERFKARHPERVQEIAQGNYRKRKASGKIDAWKEVNREQINERAREGYYRRKRQ